MPRGLKPTVGVWIFAFYKLQQPHTPSSPLGSRVSALPSHTGHWDLEKVRSVPKGVSPSSLLGVLAPPHQLSIRFNSGFTLAAPEPAICHRPLFLFLRTAGELIASTRNVTLKETRSGEGTHLPRTTTTNTHSGGSSPTPGIFRL